MDFGSEGLQYNLKDIKVDLISGRFAEATEKLDLLIEMMFFQNFQHLVITEVDEVSKSKFLVEVSNVYSPTLEIAGDSHFRVDLIAEEFGYSAALKKALESIMIETCSPVLEKILKDNLKLSISPGVVTTLHKQIFQEYLKVNGLLPDIYKLPIININASLAELSQRGPTFFVNPHISSSQHTFLFSVFTKKYNEDIVHLKVLNTFFGIEYEIHFPLSQKVSAKNRKNPIKKILSIDSSISEILEVAVKHILPLIDADMLAFSAVQGISGFSLETKYEASIIEKGSALGALQLFLTGLRKRLNQIKTETSTEQETANVSTES